MANGDVLQRITSPEQRERDDKEERRARVMQWLIVAIFLIIVGTWIWGVVYTYQQPRIRNMQISNARVEGASAICPGDRLTVAYNFHAEGSGLLEVDSSLWSISPPPRTIIYSASRRFVMAETIDQQILEAWAVPQSYTDFATGDQTPLAPGSYRRDLAISAPRTGSEIATASFQFEIREDCP